MEREYLQEEQLKQSAQFGARDAFRAPQIESLPDKETERLHEFQGLAMEFFSLHGIAREEGGNTIVDTDALKSLTDSILTYSDSKGYRYFERTGKTAPKDVRMRLKELAATFHREYADLSDGYLSNFLINAFHGKEAVSQEEWSEWKNNTKRMKRPEAKAIFYEPADEQQAFDAEAIKESQFHIGVWEIPGDKPDYYSPRTPELDYNEVSLAALIYHPDYGDGVRNESGELEVTDKNGARKKLALDWFEQQTYSTMGPQKHTEGSFFRSPKLALREGLFPHLTESGLLQPEDFASVSGSEVVTKYGQERKLGQAGTVTISGVRYTLGREFDGGNYWAYKISDTLGGVLETDAEGKPNRLTHVFDLVEQDDPRLVQDKNTGHLLFGKKSGLRVIPYDEGAREVFFRRKSDETTGEFAQRTGEMENFSDVVKAKHEVVRQAGISLEDLSPREQYQFLSFYKSAEPEQKVAVYAFVKKFGRDGMRAFLSLEVDSSIGESLIKLGDILKPKNMNEMLEAYADCIDTMEEECIKLSQEMGGDDAEMERRLFDGLMFRAKDIFFTVYRQMTKEGANQDAVVKKSIRDVQIESKKEQALSGQFRKMVELLKRDAIDPRVYKKDQSDLLLGLQEAGGLGLFLRALSSRGELKPIPEIHWRVDRSTDEYARRFGFDVPRFFRDIADGSHPGVLLELGPGSGRQKAERTMSGSADAYVDIAIADTVYFSLKDFIKNVINEPALVEEVFRRTGARPGAEDLEVIYDMLYKRVMIGGNIENDSVSYNTSTISRITQDPNEIFAVLGDVAPTLASVHVIPDNFSPRDSSGSYRYPYKINVSERPHEEFQSLSEKDARPRSQEFLTAKQLLTEHMATYLRSTEDAFNLVPAYPQGILIGDFSKISSFREETIDRAFGVRSTVYKEGEQYIAFMEQMIQRLSKDGIYIDDNIRENDGWGYRLAELYVIQEKMRNSISEPLHFYIIVGPGMEGEGERVPMGIAISKGVDYGSQIQQRIADEGKGFSLTTFDEYVEALRSDKTKVFDVNDPRNASLEASVMKLEMLVSR